MTDYTVVVFPERLREGAMPAPLHADRSPRSTRTLRDTRPSAGDYLAAAVESLEQGGHGILRSANRSNPRRNVSGSPKVRRRRSISR